MGILSDKRRFVLEHRAMTQQWGDCAKLMVDEESGRCWWECDVRVEGHEFPIRIEYPDNYPATPPVIRARSSLPSKTPHLLSNRRLCWFYPGETKRSRNRWTPSSDTAALALGVAHRWFLAYLVWRTTGRWPVKDALE